MIKNLNLPLVSRTTFYTALFTWVIGLSLATANAGAIDGTNEVEILAYHFEGHSYICSATKLRLMSAPRVEIDKNEPPLSPRSAFLSAEKYAHSVVPEAASFKMREISLRRLYGSFCFYVVKLEPDLKQQGAPMEPIQIPVLMDGTVADREEQILDPKLQAYVPKK